MAEQLDPEMLKHLDLLLALDVLEQHQDWSLLEELEDAENDPSEVRDEND